MSHDSPPDPGRRPPVPPPVPPAVPPVMPPPLPQLSAPPPPLAAFDEPQADLFTESVFAAADPVAEPAFAATDPDAEPASFEIVTRRVARRRARGEGPLGFIVSLLLVAAAGTLAYVAWPKLAPHLRPDLGPVGLRSGAKSVAVNPDVPEPAAPARLRPADRVTDEPPPAPRPAPPRDERPVDREPAAIESGAREPVEPAAVEPEPGTPRPGEPEQTSRPLTTGSPFEEPPASAPAATNVPAAPPAPPAPPAADVAADRVAVDRAIRDAARALHGQDWATAGDRLTAAEAASGDDADSIARVGRWRRLLLYAEGFEPLRDQALAASVGNEYTVDGKVISIVEANKARFIYRRLGRNTPLPGDQIPRAIVVEIVSQWFAGADRPANHLYLGAFHACREPPNLAAARAAWQRASAGGENDGDRLLQLLDDPALVAAGP